MGWLKKISSAMEKADKKYAQAKKDTAGARRVAMKVVDFVVPPPKKKAGRSRGKTVKIGDQICTCRKSK